MHHLYHRSTTRIELTCYLQDLFTAPAARAQGVGRRLIEGVYAAARAAGIRRVYRQTHETNAAGRRLYDGVARHSAFSSTRTASDPMADSTPTTARLLLRPWKDEDRPAYAAMNQDPEVMRFFPALHSREVSDKAIDAWNAELATRGWSNWVAEIRETGQFIGFIGLTVPKRVLPFSPCVELRYRLCRDS